MDDLFSAEALRVLQTGTMEIEGVLPWSSNYAFLVTVCEGDIEIPAVYKPRRGERPLWDFPRGTLSQREMAAYVVSETLGWNLVPPTVLRSGQHGPGTVQMFIEHDPNQHYFSLEGDSVFRTSLQKVALLDLIINNADRKGGHVIIESTEGDDVLSLPTGSPRIWGIDHGICFHADYKLRTVIWEFAGEEIPAVLLEDLNRFCAGLVDPTSTLSDQLSSLLEPDEISALIRRTEKLLRQGVFPEPGPGRHYPWPPV